MQYFANAVSNRQASYEYLSRGLNLQKLTNTYANPFKSAFKGTGIAHRGINTFLVEASIANATQEPVPIKPFHKHDLVPIPMPAPGLIERYPVAYSCDKPLSLTEIKTHNLIKHNPLPDHPNIYLSGDVTLLQGANIYKALLKPDRKFNELGFVRGESISVKNVQRLLRIAKTFYACANELVAFGDEKADFTVSFIESLTFKETNDPKLQFTVDSTTNHVHVSKAYLKKFAISDGDVFDTIFPSKAAGSAFATPKSKLDYGHVFGYFPGSTPADLSTAFDFLRPQLEHVIGPNSTRCYEAWKDLCEVMGAVNAHPVAGVLAHQSMALELAHEVGRTAYFIYDKGVYLGAVVKTKADLYYETNAVKSLSGDAFSDTLKSMITVAVAKATMADYFNERTFRSDGLKGPPVSAVDITSVQVFLQMCLDRNVQRYDAIDNDVKNALATLSIEFSKKTPNPSPDAMKHVLQNLVDQTSFPEATYLDTLLLTNEETYSIAWLSVFGLQRSISLRNLGGKRKDLFQDPANDPAPVKKEITHVPPRGRGRGGRNKNAPPPTTEVVSIPYWHRLIFTRPTIDIALKDWTALVESHYLLQSDAAKSSQAYLIYEDGEAKELVSVLRVLGFDSAVTKEKKKATFVDKDMPGEDVEDAEESGAGPVEFDF